MSTHRLIKRNVVADEAQLSVRESVAYGFDCSHCPREFLVISGGVLTIKSPHGDEVHANAVTMIALFRKYMSFAPKSALLNLREAIDRRLREMAA